MHIEFKCDILAEHWPQLPHVPGSSWWVLPVHRHERQYAGHTSGQDGTPSHLHTRNTPGGEQNQIMFFFLYFYFTVPVERFRVLCFNFFFCLIKEFKWNCIITPNLLPGAGAVGLAGSVHSCLVLSQVDQSGGQTAKVGHVVVKQFGCFVHLVVIAAVTHLQDRKRARSAKLEL